MAGLQRREVATRLSIGEITMLAKQVILGLACALVVAFVAQAQECPNAAGVDTTKFPPAAVENTFTTTTYVRASAKQGGNGSRRRPYRSIGRALRTVQPHTRIVVAPGTYREERTLVVRQDHVLLTGQDNTTKVIVKPANAETKIAIHIAASYVCVRGFEFADFKDAGIHVGRKGHTLESVIVRQVAVRNTYEAIRTLPVEPTNKMVQVRGLRIDGCSFTAIAGIGVNIGEGPVENLVVDHVTIDMTPNPQGDSGADGIGVEAGDHILIRHVTVRGPAADGIDIKGSHVAIYDSDVRRCGRNGVKLWQGGDVVNTIVSETGADAAVVFGPGRYRMLHCLVTRQAEAGRAYALTIANASLQERSELTLINCAFVDNAGAVWVAAGCKVAIVNCLLTGSRSGEELVISIPNNQPLLLKSNGSWQAMEQARAAFACLPPGTDPKLGKDLIPARTSPLVNAGAKLPKHYPPSDILGQRRVRGRRPDIGPFEVR